MTVLFIILFVAAIVALTTFLALSFSKSMDEFELNIKEVFSNRII